MLSQFKKEQKKKVGSTAEEAKKTFPLSRHGRREMTGAVGFMTAHIYDKNFKFKCVLLIYSFIFTYFSGTTVISHMPVG